ncbi:thyroid receptor-interacting protein 11-like isoform X2 [Schistocerca cancellata]|uniref:thyroid receptor-interacting protein 11-like isoform X2 n=1 Tax=Schistocerca cancellata TaxID=274614 RepID=UPI00211826FD|nr:thyroid receptor-interacting protein 11-like isoform X2 [Schistocerca cancellata]
MSWFGEGLSTLKGQLQNFTKEVLSDGAEEANDERTPALLESKQKCDELEALCEAQNLEISALRKQISQLQREPRDGAAEIANNDQNEAPWWTVEHRCDPSFSSGSKTAASGDRSDLNVLAFEKKLREKGDELDNLRDQFYHLQKENEKLRLLSTEDRGSKCANCQSRERKLMGEDTGQPMEQKEEKWIELEEKLIVSTRRTQELETELQCMWELCQRYLMDTQVQELENVVKQLKMERKDHHPNTLVETYGYQQDVVRGTWKKIQQENKDLKLRIEELESLISSNNKGLQQELQNGFTGSESVNKSVRNFCRMGPSVSVMNRTMGKTLETSVHQLDDASCMVQQKEENAIAATTTAAEEIAEHVDTNAAGATPMDKKQHEAYAKAEALLKEEKEKLQESNVFLKSEMVAMAKVIQDLESQLADIKGENDCLNNSIEELDKQHQAAIEQLLHVKSTLQKQNDTLNCEIQELRKEMKEMTPNGHLENLLKQNKALKDEIEELKANCDALSKASIETHNCDNDNMVLEAVNTFKAELDMKLAEIITLDIPKDFYTNRDSLDVINTVEALTKMCMDFKWKKETLERKVVELMKEITDSKQTLNGHEETIKMLENECKLLNSSVESLVEELHVFKSGTDEVLAPIPENSEEIEALEQKITALENEVDVLREARSNLETDAAKLREHESNLVKQLQSTEAMLRNQENIQREAAKWQEMADDAKREINELRDSKLTLEAEIDKLKIHEQTVSELRGKNEVLHDDILMARSEVQLLTEKVAEYENSNSALRDKVMELEEKIAAANRQSIDDKTELRKMQELLKVTQDKLGAAENMLISIETEHDNLRKVVELRDAEITGLKKNLEELDKMSESMAELRTAHTSLQKHLTDSEQELQSIKSQFEISEKLNSLLHEKLNIKFMSSKVLVGDEVGLQRKLTEIENCGSADKHYIDQLRNELHTKELKLYALDQEISALRMEEERWKKDKETVDELQCMYHEVLSQLNRKEEEIMAVKETLAASEQINAVLHKKLNISYKGIEALQQGGPSVQQIIHEIENVIIRDENEFRNLNNELQQKQCKIQELESLNEMLKKEITNHLQGHWEMGSQKQDLSSQSNIHNTGNMEVLKWKEAAFSAEQQVDNTLQLKSDSSKECQKLLIDEPKMHDTELESEMSQDKLQQRYESCRSHSLTDGTAHADLIFLKQLLSAKNKELSEKQQEIFELQLQCQRLQDVEAALTVARNEAANWKSEVYSIQQKLQEEMKYKTELTLVTEKLLVAEEELTRIKQKQKEFEQLREAKQSLESKYEELCHSKTKLEDEMEKLKDMDKSNLSKIHSDKSVMTNVKVLDGTHLYAASADHVQRETVQYITETNNSTLGRSPVLPLLQERNSENNLLKLENNKLIPLAVSDKSTASIVQENNDGLKDQIRLQNEEVIGMAKETIANLSKIIQDKDIEIEGLKGKTLQLQHEKDELVKTVHIKHQENIQYHNEIQRLSGLLSQELRRSQEIQQQHRGLVKQHEDKQKLLLNTQNEVISLKQRLERLEASYISQSSNAEIEGNAPIREGNHTDELKSIIVSKDQVIEKTVSRLSICEQELELKQQEVKLLKDQLNAAHHTQRTVDCEKNDGLKVAESFNTHPNNMVGNEATVEPPEQATLISQIQDMEQEYHRLTVRLHEEQAKTKYLENELQEKKEKGITLQKELDRLREHLVTVEESYTQETLRAEQQVQSLQARLSSAEERLKCSSTAYTSASILVNQQVEALQNQNQTLVQQKEEAFLLLSSAEDKVQKQEAALRNLQAVLERFQKDKEREISLEVMKVQKQLKASEKNKKELVEEIQSLKMQLGKANEGLSAAARLGEQLDRKTETIASLKEKVAELTEKLEKAEQLSQSKVTVGENKIDRNLVKNLVLGYFSAPAASKSQVLRVLGSVLELCPDELSKLGLASSSPDSNQSLSEAFIRFLENESRPQPKLRLLPQTQEQAPRERSTPSPSSSSTSSRRSPLLLSEVHLPTFTQFPAARSSSSILKDVLKES